MPPHLFGAPARPPMSPLEAIICRSIQEGDPVDLLSEMSEQLAAFAGEEALLTTSAREDLRGLALAIGALAERLATPNPRSPA